jgi:hypothetical protein
MSQLTTYYAIIDDETNRENPAGIARRVEDTDGGFIDEGLHVDLKWHRTPVIVEWERAESAGDLAEVSAEEAELIIDRLAARWASGEGG